MKISEIFGSAEKLAVNTSAENQPKKYGYPKIEPHFYQASQTLKENST